MSVSLDIQTSRSELKNEVIAEFFNQLRGVRLPVETRLSSVSYHIPNELVFKGKFGCKVDKMLC